MLSRSVDETARWKSQRFSKLDREMPCLPLRMIEELAAETREVTTAATYDFPKYILTDER